jgi:hypothetical protein
MATQHFRSLLQQIHQDEPVGSQQFGAQLQDFRQQLEEVCPKQSFEVVHTYIGIMFDL